MVVVWHSLMNAGRIAGEVAGDAVKDNKFDAKTLEAYKTQWYGEEWKKFNKRLMLRKVLEKLNDDDLNHIISQLDQTDIDLVLNGNFMNSISKVTLKRPQLLKVLTVLMNL